LLAFVDHIGKHDEWLDDLAEMGFPTILAAIRKVIA
jgi:hypothetical protein